MAGHAHSRRGVCSEAEGVSNGALRSAAKTKRGVHTGVTHGRFWADVINSILTPTEKNDFVSPVSEPFVGHT